MERKEKNIFYLSGRRCEIEQTYLLFMRRKKFSAFSIERVGRDIVTCKVDTLHNTDVYIDREEGSSRESKNNKTKFEINRILYI